MQYCIDYVDKNRIDRQFTTVAFTIFMLYLFFKFLMKNEKIADEVLLWGLPGGILLLAFLISGARKKAIIKVDEARISLHLDRGGRRISFDEILTYYVESSLFRNKLMLILKDGTQHYFSSYLLFNKKESLKKLLVTLEQNIERWKNFNKETKDIKRMKTVYESAWFSLLVGALGLITIALLFIGFYHHGPINAAAMAATGAIIFLIITINIVKAKAWNKMILRTQP